MLWVVRHGESAGNVARDKANAAGLAEIVLESRDVEVPLSTLGIQQSRALGHWFASMDLKARPEVILCSPYLRAKQTAEAIQREDGISSKLVGPIIDERLREKEFGILDRLTRYGIQQRESQQAEIRQLLGKFYHRPPGGESWCDVILRLRSVLDTISLHYAGKRVLIVGHQVVVLCMRYLLENMDEKKVLAIDAGGDVMNCAVTEYSFRPEQDGEGRLELTRYNFVAPTPDVNVRAR